MKPPPYNARVAIVGSTGTGKSTLARELALDNDRLIVIDSKHGDDVNDPVNWPDMEEWKGPFHAQGGSALKNAIRHLATKGADSLEDSIKLQKRMEGTAPFRALFRPPPDYAEDGGYEKLWHYIFNNLRHVTVYIDELYLTLKQLGRGGTWLQALYSQGRGRKIGMWSTMQAPVWIPRVVLRECEYFYIFRLNLEDDIKTMRGITRGVDLDGITGHALTVYNATTRETQSYNKVDVTE